MEIICALRDRKDDLIFKNHNDDTPLHVAAKAGKVSVVKVLIELDRGVINAQNKQGNTSLHLAMKSGEVELIQSLINNGADLHISNNRGETPYALTVKYNLLSQLKILDTDKSVHMEIDQGQAIISSQGNPPEQKLPVPEGLDMSTSPQLVTPTRSLPANLFSESTISSSSTWQGLPVKDFPKPQRKAELKDEMDMGLSTAPATLKRPRDEALTQDTPKKFRFEEKKSEAEKKPPPSPMR